MTLADNRPATDAGDNLLDDYWPEREFAVEQLHVCLMTLRRWRALGEGPPITRVGRRNYVHKPSGREWLRSREVNPEVAEA